MRRRLGTSAKEDDATIYIQQAILGGSKLGIYPRWCSIQGFNDYRMVKFSEIRDVMHRARQLAVPSYHTHSA